MIGLVGAVAAAALFGQLAGAVPLGYHTRHEAGWTLIAASMPIDGYVACLAARPPMADLPADDDIRVGLVSGRAAERMEGASPGALVQRLLTHRPGDDARARALDPVDAHLIALAGARWPALGFDGTGDAAAPVLLLAGDADPAELMATLIDAAGALPVAKEPRSDARPRAAPPALGWWRHIPGEDDGVALALHVPGSSPSPAFAARVALAAITETLRAHDPSLTTRVHRLDDGHLHVFHWPASPATMPARRARLREAIGNVRDAPLVPEVFDRVVEAIVAEDRAALRRPRDPWFSDLIAPPVAGEPPPSAMELRRASATLTPQRLREAASVYLGREPIAVTQGGWDPSITPTERWPARDVVFVERLDAPLRERLASDAIARAARALWDEREPEAVTVEAEWTLARREGPLAGRIVETLGFADGIRRDFHPAGPDLAISSWLVGDSLRTTVQGAPRDTLDGERRRLDARLRTDPWRAVRRARQADPDVLKYAGTKHRHGDVFQSVTVSTPDGLVDVWFSPETGLPASVFIDRGPRMVSTEYRYSMYADERGTRYPRRIERHVGPRREAIFQVRTHAAASRLAASERLK